MLSLVGDRRLGSLVDPLATNGECEIDRQPSSAAMDQREVGEWRWRNDVEGLVTGHWTGMSPETREAGQPAKLGSTVEPDK